MAIATLFEVLELEPLDVFPVVVHRVGRLVVVDFDTLCLEEGAGRGEVGGNRLTVGDARLDLGELGAGQRVLDLRHLEVDGRYANVATDAHIAQLARLKELTVLRLTAVRVTDAGLAHLAVLKNLRQLDLAESRVTDVGIDHLLGLSKLEQLDISGTEITDKGLAKLRRLPRLRVVTAYNTKIPWEAVEGDKAVLPGVDVVMFD